MPRMLLLGLMGFCASLVATSHTNAQQMNEFGLHIPNVLQSGRNELRSHYIDNDIGVGDLFPNGSSSLLVAPPKFLPPPALVPACLLQIKLQPSSDDRLSLCNTTSTAITVSFKSGNATLSIDLPSGATTEFSASDGSDIVASVGDLNNRYSVEKGHSYVIEKSNENLLVLNEP